MVVTTSAAGAGGLKIRGSLDTSMIERGFTRVKQGFASVKGFAKGFTADLTRMRQESTNLTKGLMRVALIGSAALLALATKAPAVAPAMAKMGVAIGKIQRTLGEGLAPAFEKVSGWLDKLAAWSSAHPKIFSGLVIAFTSLAVLKMTGITGFLTSLAGLVISPALLTALGYLAAIGGVAYAGAKVAEFFVDKAKGFLFERAAQIPGTPQALADITQAEINKIKEEGFQPTPNGMISVWKEGEFNRRFLLLSLWDALWG